MRFYKERLHIAYGGGVGICCKSSQNSRGYKYAGSNNVDKVVWYWDNIGKHTHIAGTKAPNELGIYDMKGNVWKWCWDWYAKNYDSHSPQDNPKAPLMGRSHVLRGGS